MYIIICGIKAILLGRFNKYSLILLCLFCNKTNLYPKYVVIWYVTSVVDKIQLFYISKSYDNQIIGKLKPPQGVIIMESDWSEEELDLIHYYIK